jgi:endonuclease G, mitochondrial
LYGWFKCELLNVSFEIHWILSKCKRERRILMVTGSVLTSNKGKTGLDGVSIPKYFYKILYDPKGQGEMIAFLIPNEKSIKPVQEYVVSLN